MTDRAVRFVHLDMLRGLAALAVVTGHIRAFVLTDYDPVHAPGLLIKAAYGLTSLGHQAVIAFFALSGFLVGGKALRDMDNGTWSWRHYVIARLSRLWTMVLPALVLTLLLDTAGRALGGVEGYAGFWHGSLSSGPDRAFPADDGLIGFLGKALFLQTIAVTPFGSNGPLWSLANEFWYYAVVPLAASALLVEGSMWARLAACAGAALITALLPVGLTALGAIWVAGAAASRVMSWPASHSVAVHTATGLGHVLNFF